MSDPFLFFLFSPNHRRAGLGCSSLQLGGSLEQLLSSAFVSFVSCTSFLFSVLYSIYGDLYCELCYVLCFGGDYLVLLVSEINLG